MPDIYSFPDGRQFMFQRGYPIPGGGFISRQDNPLNTPFDIDQMLNYLGPASLMSIWQSQYAYTDLPGVFFATPSEVRKRLKQDILDGSLRLMPYNDPQDAPDAIDIAIRTARASLKMHLTTIIQEELKEKAAREKEYQKLNPLEKGLVSTGAAFKGLGKAGFDFLIWTDNIVDVVDINRRAMRVAKAAKETYWDDNKKTFGANLMEAEYQTLIKALGFDPSKITRAQIKEAMELAQLIWDDEETRSIIARFGLDYAKAQHHTELTEMAGGLTFEVLLTIIIAALTGGAGAAAAAAKNALLITRFEKAGNFLVTIGRKLKRLKIGRKRKVIGTGKTAVAPAHTPPTKYDKVDDVLHKADADAKKKADVDAKKAPAKVPVQPKNLDDAVNKLAVARENIAKHGYVSKYTDAELKAMAQSGSIPKERFYVRFSTAPIDKVTKDVIEAADNAGAMGYQRPSGRHPVWMSTFDQIENADTDPKLISEVFGTPYDPSKKYVMYIVDMGEDFDKSGTDLFVPTFENMNKKLKTEFAGDIPPENIDKIMTESYSQDFKKHWGEYQQWAKDNKMNAWAPSSIEEFAETPYFNSSADSQLFKDRSKVLNEVGAWEIFRGDGLTENLTGKGSYGALEVLAIQHDPVPVKDMVTGPNPTATMIKLW